ncbi:MAG TPA: DUF1707 domain-containing protein [Gaiellaceae bacterium]|nr:DUF1707 domain-containing protein [Gaiellaceae bacterium]
MSGDLVRASDDDRERAIRALREHLAAGRLTLEEFTERMSAALAATTTADLDAPLRELPVAVRTRRRPTRFLLALFGSTERAGRLRLRRRALCVSLFGNVDFDLRQATLEGDVITIFAVAAFAALDVYVPERVEVDLHGLTVFGHKDAQGSDVEPLPGTPLVRVYAFGIFAGMDVWRVPLAWATRTLGEAIEGIERGEHRELEP